MENKIKATDEDRDSAVTAMHELDCLHVFFVTDPKPETIIAFNTVIQHLIKIQNSQ